MVDADLKVGYRDNSTTGMNSINSRNYQFKLIRPNKTGVPNFLEYYLLLPHNTLSAFQTMHPLFQWSYKYLPG